MEFSEYWNPKNETLPRAELQALQLLKLRRTCEWAWARSGFHRRLWEKGGFHPDQLKSLDDLRRIPFMTREDWMEAQAERPVFGDLTTVDPALAIRYHTTSGTSGRIPLRVLDGRKDWEWIAEMWAYGFWAFGVRPGDRVFFAFSYGVFIGFWGAHYCCEKIGALVLPSGGSTTERSLRPARCTRGLRRRSVTPCTWADDLRTPAAHDARRSFRPSGGRSTGHPDPAERSHVTRR